MKHSYTTLITSLLLAISSTAIAAEREIEIAVSKGSLLELYGTAFDGLHQLVLNQVKKGNSISLGKVGVQSNVQGACEISFTTANNYQLINKADISNPIILTDFNLLYNGRTFNKDISAATRIASCNVNPTDLTLTPAKVEGTIAAGTYKDTITVTVVVAS